MTNGQVCYLYIRIMKDERCRHRLSICFRLKSNFLDSVFRANKQLFGTNVNPINSYYLNQLI